VRNAHAREELTLIQPRWAISLLLGPMTRTEIRRARGQAADRNDSNEPAADDDGTTRAQGQQKGS
jgi:hypothetical protein